MKKIIYLLLVGFLMIPSVMNAERNYSKEGVKPSDFPTKSPVSLDIVTSLNETTGLLTMYFIGNVGNVEMTISQNGTVIDYDCFAGSNGGTETYSFASYAVGEYLLTLETENGSVSQYIITVEDD